MNSYTNRLTISFIISSSCWHFPGRKEGEKLLKSTSAWIWGRAWYRLFMKIMLRNWKQSKTKSPLISSLILRVVKRWLSQCKFTSDTKKGISRKSRIWPTTTAKWMEFRQRPLTLPSLHVSPILLEGIRSCSQNTTLLLAVCCINIMTLLTIIE